MFMRSHSFNLIFSLTVIFTFFFLPGYFEAGKDEVSANGQDERVEFLIATEAKIRSTTIIVKGQSYRVDVVTLSVCLENPAPKSLDVDISANIQMIHPEKPDAFRLIKKDRGPYVVNLGSGKTQEIELEYMQQPAKSSCKS